MPPAPDASSVAASRDVVDDFDVGHMYELGRKRPQHESRKPGDFGKVHSKEGKLPGLRVQHDAKKKVDLSELAATGQGLPTSSSAGEGPGASKGVSARGFTLRHRVDRKDTPLGARSPGAAPGPSPAVRRAPRRAVRGSRP